MKVILINSKQLPEGTVLKEVKTHKKDKTKYIGLFCSFIGTYTVVVDKKNCKKYKGSFVDVLLKKAYKSRSTSK